MASSCRQLGGYHNRDSTIKHSNGLVVANIDRRRFHIRRENAVTILPGVHIAQTLAMLSVMMIG
jgi:hypothetical protein